MHKGDEIILVSDALWRSYLYLMHCGEISVHKGDEIILVSDASAFSDM